jgi:hypothetical protein
MRPPGTILGAAQAEADDLMLERAFLETADFQALLHTSDFNYVIGRRGAGKSALFLRLKLTFEKDEGTLLLADQPQDFEMVELQAILKSISAEYRVLRPITRLLWTVHFLLETTKRLIRHYRFEKRVNSIWLIDYVNQHGVKGDVSGAAHCVRHLLKLRHDNVPAEQIPRLIAETFEVGALTDAVREGLVETGLRAVTLYDRLDESWVAEVQPIAILGGLARTAADYREKHFPFYPVLFIRDNMLRALAQYDDDFTRHIEGHMLRLRWDEESLFHLVAARLRVALSAESIESEVKVWNRFAQRGLEGRAGFADCLKHTLYRPRDILVLLNNAYANAQRDKRDHIVETDVEKTAKEISQNRLEDLCKEYDKVLPGLRSFVSAFRGQPAKRSLTEVADSLQAMSEGSDYSAVASRDFQLFQTGGDMFGALYSVGFVGLKDETNPGYTFCHDGTMVALVSVPGSRETMVHPCYWKALDIHIEQEVAQEVTIEVNDEYETAPTGPTVALRLQRLGRLPEELGGIPEGRPGSAQFEGWVLRTLRLLCAGHLTNIEHKPNPNTALNQRDIVATNATVSPFWRRVYEEHKSRQVIFECKNYRELTPDDFRQVLDYSSGQYGQFVAVVRRGVNEHLTTLEQDRIRAMFYEHQRIVMVIPAPLLILCIRKLRTTKKYDYTEFTLSKHMDYIVRSVLSLTHAPRYKLKRKK